MNCLPAAHPSTPPPTHPTNKLKEYLNIISGGATFSTGFSSKAFTDFSDRSILNEES